MIKNIAITGPESTGKTMLTEQLTKHYNGIYVPEFARDYIAKLHKPYSAKDLENIAVGQIKSYNDKLALAQNYLFSDTELIVIKIWFEHSFGYCPEWILKAITEQKFELYLLCNIDLPWTYDEQREHPHMRDYFFNLYLQELQNRNLPFIIISGLHKNRVNNAIKAVRQII